MNKIYTLLSHREYTVFSLYLLLYFETEMIKFKFIEFLFCILNC